MLLAVEVVHMEQLGGLIISKGVILGPGIRKGCLFGQWYKKGVRHHEEPSR